APSGKWGWRSYLGSFQSSQWPGWKAQTPSCGQRGPPSLSWRSGDGEERCLGLGRTTVRWRD
ncbi:hypothetical protein MMC08_008697, partial [Hypocenomyce scalaris]|nr:hypothetical protein [Hypocenomyce scalaris]